MMPEWLATIIAFVMLLGSAGAIIALGAAFFSALEYLAKWGWGRWRAKHPAPMCYDAAYGLVVTRSACGKRRWAADTTYDHGAVTCDDCLTANPWMKPLPPIDAWVKQQRQTILGIQEALDAHERAMERTMNDDKMWQVVRQARELIERAREAGLLTETTTGTSLTVAGGTVFIATSPAGLANVALHAAREHRARRGEAYCGIANPSGERLVSAESDDAMREAAMHILYGSAVEA